MPVDIDTEIAQMWAGSRIIADVLGGVVKVGV